MQDGLSSGLAIVHAGVAPFHARVRLPRLRLLAARPQ
jgi:hypothetical protein